MTIASHDRPGERDFALRAFLFAPPIAVASALLLTHGWYLSTGGASADALVYRFIVAWLFVTIGAYVSAGIMGLPVYLAMRAAGLVSPWWAVMAASAIAFLSAWMLGVHPFGRSAPAGSSYSYFAEGCRVVVDNLLTDCGRRILARDSAAVYLAGPISGLVFRLIHAGGWKTRPERS